MNTTMPFSEYRDRLRQALPHWPELGWLDDFLNYPGPADGPKTEVCIVDFGDHSQVLNIEHCMTLQAELSNGRRGAGGRLILVHYSSSWSVDRNVVDLVATHFELDPCALTDHFFHHRIVKERQYPGERQDMDAESVRNFSRAKTRWSYSAHPRSEVISGVMGTAVFGFQMSGVLMAILKDRDTSEAVVFIREDPGEFSGMGKFLQISQGRSIWQVESGQGTPQSIKDFLLSNLTLVSEDHSSSQQLFREHMLPLAVEPFMLRAVTSSNVFLQSYRLSADGTVINDSDQLFDQYRDLQFLKGQLGKLNQPVTASWNQSYIQQSLALLENICSDMDRHRHWIEGHNRRQDDDYLHYLVDSQRMETKSSLNASTQIGRITRLAYIFLPLQLTTSILGMNLKVFGSGTLSVSTFTTILILLGTAALSPIILPAVLPLWIFKRALRIWPYSQRVCIVVALFSLTQSKSNSNMLWNRTGIDYDIEIFEGRRSGPRKVDGDGWLNGRKELDNAIQTSLWSPLARFWTGQLEDIYRIIDKPMWGLHSGRDQSGNQRNAYSASSV